MKNDEIKNEIYEIKKWENEINRIYIYIYIYIYIFIYIFQQYDKVRSFGDSTYTGKISIDEAEMDQTNLLKNITDFSDKSRPK